MTSPGLYDFIQKHQHLLWKNQFWGYPVLQQRIPEVAKWIIIGWSTCAFIWSLLINRLITLLRKSALIISKCSTNTCVLETVGHTYFNLMEWALFKKKVISANPIASQKHCHRALTLRQQCIFWFLESSWNCLKSSEAVHNIMKRTKKKCNSKDALYTFLMKRRMKNKARMRQSQPVSRVVCASERAAGASRWLGVETETSTSPTLRLGDVGQTQQIEQIDFK